MHEGKQVKEPVSRVIQRAKGKGTQQFSSKRGGSMIQETLKHGLSICQQLYASFAGTV